MKRISVFFVIVLSMLVFAGCGNDISDISGDTTTKFVEDYDITINMALLGEEVEVSGKYTGELVEGKPQGEGEFTAYLENDLDECSYKGSFFDGYYDGYGVLTVDTEDIVLEMAGTYTKGEFTPTVSETYNLIGQLDYLGKFTLSDSISEYMDLNEDLFATTVDTIKEMDISEFSHKQFAKTGKQEKVELVKLKNLYAMQVFEEDFFNDKLTWILASDDDFNYYAIYYLGTAELYAEDTFTLYSIPCANSSFENVSGGVTNVVVMAASCIE